MKSECDGCCYKSVAMLQPRVRNQLRKGWDARMHKLWCRMSDLQDEIDFETSPSQKQYTYMYLDRLNASLVRVERALRRCTKLTNPWK